MERSFQPIFTNAAATPTPTDISITTTAASTPAPIPTATTAAVDATAPNQTYIPNTTTAASIPAPIPTATTAAPNPTHISNRTTAASTPAPISTATTAAVLTPPVDAAATTASPLYPASVLLLEEAYDERIENDTMEEAYDEHIENDTMEEAYDERIENDTTAEAMMSTKHTVKVTFFLADPPAVSYFCVHSPELEHAEICVVPRVVFSVKHLVLFRFAFTLRPGSTARRVPPAQYFVYKAAHGHPSLTPIPTTRQLDNDIASYPSILPLEGEDGNFLLADLAVTLTRGHYVLHIFSSKKKEWTARPLQLQLSTATKENLPSVPHKVIALGAGTIGWIDLWRGIIVCNVFDLDPVLHFVPLPKPAFNLRRDGNPKHIRDVTCFNGFIKFVEMEHYPTPVSNIKRNFKTTKDLDTSDVLYDSELFFHSHADVLDEPSSVPSTWKIRTCYRHTSWKHWCKGLTVHVDDILVNDPSYYAMLPELWDVGAGKFTLANLTTVRPTFSIHDGNVVYLVSRVGDYNQTAWVVSVDLRKKTVEMLESYEAGTPFLACTFSGYLNQTPRSCAPEDCCGQNHLLNGYLTPGNIIQNHPNMQIVDGYSRSSIDHGNFVQGNLVHPVNRYLFQPPLVVPPQGFPQTLQHNFTQSGSGPMSAQSTYAVLNTNGHAQPWPSMPMDNRFAQPWPSMPMDNRFAQPWPSMPMDNLFQTMTPGPVYPAVPQMPPVSADSSVVFD